MGEMPGRLDDLCDEDLATLCAERPVRDEAWVVFYRRFQDLVRGQVARTLKGFPMEMEDLIQIAFLRVFKALPRYDPKRSRIKTFLSAVVTNAVIDVLRHGRDDPTDAVALDDALILLQIRAERDPLLVQDLAVRIVDRLANPRKLDIVNDLLDGKEVTEICADRNANPSEVYSARRWLHDLIREVGAALK